MSEITHQAAQRVAMLLTASIKSVVFYPSAHPAVRQPLQELCEILDRMLGEKPEIHLGVVEGIFFLENQLFVSPNSSVAELADRLSGKGVDAFTLFPGITRDDLFHFASLFARRDITAEQMTAELERIGIRTIRLGIDELVYGDSAEGDGLAPSKTYLDALNAIRGTMSEIENGRIPDSGLINAVVDDMVSLAIKDHTTLLGLAMIKSYDNYTFNHSVNVGILSLSLSAFLGKERGFLRDINTAGLLHDIGKTRIDKGILNKPGKLSAEEYEEMKKHAEKGAEIVRGMRDINPAVGDAVLGHHIRRNRTGYPEWARDMDFGEMTEIVAVADCYDAITTLRAYSLPVLPRVALDIMHRTSGTSLDGALVKQFEKMMGEYPVGTLVRLDTNEIALVVRPHPMESSIPGVKVIMDANGKSLEKPRLVSLVNEAGARGVTIVATVDPVMKNVDVGRYFAV